MADSLIFIYENANGGTVVFREDSSLWITGISGISTVEASVAEAQGVGQIGATPTGVSIQPKTLTVNGMLWDRSLRSRLLAAVLPGVKARFTMLDGGQRYYLEGIPSKSPIVDEVREMPGFQFAFRCSFPYWRGEETVQTLAGLAALFRFPTSLAGEWYISRMTDSAFATVENPGNMPAPLTLRFKARTIVTNPEIYHLENGSYIRLNTTMAIGDIIEVSTVYGEKGAWQVAEDGSTTNVFRYLDIGSDLSMQLEPGTNTLRVSAEVGEDGLDVEIIAPKGVWAGV